MKTYTLILLSSLLISPMMAEQSAKASRPNILLIMADDMGWKDLHCQGNNILRTPNLDRFAAEGVRFTNAYAAAPVCSPTRAALITGLAPARLHITQHGPDGKQFWPDDRTIQPPLSDNTLPLARVTLAERLKAVGYATGFFGKWHLGGKGFYPDNQGFDINIAGCNLGGTPTYYDPYRIPTLKDRKPGEYLTDRLADETIQWMEKQKDSPMFICLWTYNPHFPFEAPEELTAHFKGKEGHGLINPIYGGQIEAMDRAIGRVLDHVKTMGIVDNTLVIFTSDNGGWNGATDNRPLRDGKGFLYEGGLRVPLAIRWPGVTKAGGIKETPVVSMDLTASILDAAGVDIAKDESLDGESLRSLFDGGSLKRDAICWNYPHWSFHKGNRPGAAIRMGNDKLIRNYDDGSLELYDIVADLGEKNNLAAQKTDRANKMNARLQQWLEETKAGIPTKREQK